MPAPQSLLLACLWAGLTLTCVWIALELYALYSAAPWVPSSRAQAQAMVALARPQPGELWVDLGSGDGRLLLAAAGLGATAVGYELLPHNVLRARWRARRAGLQGSVRVRWGSLWKADIRQADVISVYLMPYRMEKLRAKLAAEAKPGCRIVVNSFEIPGWPKRAEDTSLMIFLYVKESH